MGSSRPNWVRRFARTSGGTLGLVASSSNGSPGAKARIVKRTKLMPSRVGTEMRSRRRRYLDIGGAGGGWRPGLSARSSARDYASRYQWGRFQKSESQHHCLCLILLEIVWSLVLH